MDPDSGNWERYSRQILFAPLGREGQRRLRDSRVAIVGCGALGSAQADLLTRAGVGFLRLIDRDSVESSNLQRQSLFDEEDARQGLPKAAAAAARLGRVNAAVAVQGVVADLVPENAAALLGDCHLLLDGADNLETRYLVNDYALAHAIPWIYGAAVAARGATFTVIPGQTACLVCLFGELEQGGVIETCETAGVLSWAVHLVAAWQVAEAVKLLVGAEDRLRPTLLSLEVWDHRLREWGPPARDPGCRACGRRDFLHLRGEGRPPVTLCGRNAVQIHEHRQEVELPALADRLRPLGEVRANAFALRFTPRASSIEMIVFPDGRAMIQGTTDTALARSLYARYLGS